MKFNQLKNIFVVGVLVSTLLVTGCTQTVSGGNDTVLNSRDIPEQLELMSASPNFKQTTVDEIEYVTTFSSWAEASETLGLDLAPCADDDHSVSYNVLPNYSILQSEYGVGCDTFEFVQPDGELIGEGLDCNQTDGVLLPDIGIVDEAVANNQSNGVESITVFIPNGKNNKDTSLLKLSDRISVDDDELYSYFNDYNSIASSRETQWEYIQTVHIDDLDVDADFCTADSTLLFAFVIYDGCLFQVSYGLVDENDVQAVVNSINE